MTARSRQAGIRLNGGRLASGGTIQATGLGHGGYGAADLGPDQGKTLFGCHASGVVPESAFPMTEPKLPTTVSAP